MSELKSSDPNEETQSKDVFSDNLTFKRFTNPMKTSFERVFHPSKLERKHSSGDLHSRLKTRKLLGVGEIDIGEIHRSKISQVLGHNEHLYIKLPKGYWIWYCVLATTFTISGLLNLILPRHWLLLTQHERSPQFDSKDIYHTQLYGTSLLCISAILWRFYGTNDKVLARSLLIISATFAVIQFSVTLIHCDAYWPDRRKYFLLTLFIDITIIVVNYYYYKSMSRNSYQTRSHNVANDLITRDDSIICGASHSTKKFE